MSQISGTVKEQNSSCQPQIEDDDVLEDPDLGVYTQLYIDSMISGFGVSSYDQ
jgi:hypothetical protein